VSPLEVIRTAETLGLRLRVEEGRLKVSSPRPIPAAVRVLLRANHDAIRNLLASRERADAAVATTANAQFRFEFVTTASGVRATMPAPASSDALALTLFTSGNDPIIHRPVLLALATRERAVVFDLDAIRDFAELRNALGQASIVGHQLLPTLAFLSHHLGVLPRVAADTAVQSRLIDGGLRPDPRQHTLDAVISRCAVLVPPPSPTTDALLARHPEALAVLVARTQAAGAAARALRLEIDNEHLRGIEALEYDVLPSVVRTSLRGIAIDFGALRAVLAARSEELRAAERIVSDMDVNKDADVRRALTAAGVDPPPYLHMLREATHPLARAIATIRSGRPFVRDVAPRVLENASRYGDHRVRPTIDPLGAATGRFSYSAPNLQGLEKRAEVRRCFVPAPGHVFVVADYAAIDLRVLAFYSGDPLLLECFQRGVDPHRATAAKIAGVEASAVLDAQRTKAKAVNFGIVYGSGPDALAETLSEATGVLVSRDDAAALIDEHRRAHPGVADWQKFVRRLARTTTTTRTAGARLRRFAPKDPLPQRLNAPIQGTAADGLKQAMVLMEDALRTFGAYVVLTVHDEVVVETPVADVFDVARTVHDGMVAGMTKFVPRVPIVVEVQIRENWSASSAIATARTP
jgi:hypothetical protein